MLKSRRLGQYIFFQFPGIDTLSWNADLNKKAVSHYHAIANFEFVITLLIVCQAVLAFVKGANTRYKVHPMTFWEFFAKSKM